MSIKKRGQEIEVTAREREGRKQAFAEMHRLRPSTGRPCLHWLAEGRCTDGVGCAAGFGYWRFMDHASAWLGQHNGRGIIPLKHVLPICSIAA